MNSEVRELIDKIVNCIEENSSNITGIGWASGMSGIGLFLFYYSRLIRSIDTEELAFQLISDAVDEFNKHNSISTFCNGVAGVGWIIEYLVKNDFIESNTDELLRSIDTYVLKSITMDMRRKEYDYLHGILGKGLYLLNRKSIAKEDLEYVVDSVYEIAVKEGNYFKYKSSYLPKGILVDNLSLSHGSASVINIISRFYERGIKKERSKEIVDKSLNYLLASRLENLGSVFPSLLSPEIKPEKSRLAWCYGDLGIAASLLDMAERMNMSDIRDFAIDTLHKTTKRKDLKSNSVIDAGICHGTSGIAHIFNRVYNSTKEQEFKNAADYWVSKTIEFARYQDGIAGYKAYSSLRGLYNTYGILEGVSGIGLMLVSWLNSELMDWDECLLIS